MNVSHIKTFIVILTFLCLSSVFAEGAKANSPYLLKQGTLTDPSGQTLVKELRCGDGILVNDPCVFQIRNHKGAVIARTTVLSRGIAKLCYSLDYCVIYPYDSGSIIPKAWKLDKAQIDFDKELDNPTLNNNQEIKEEFEQYLNDKKVKRLNSLAFEYPEFEEEPSYIGFEPSNALRIFSPIAIIINNIGTLIIVALMTSVLIFLCSLFKKIKNSTSGHLRIIYLTLLAVATLGYIGFCLASLLVISLNFPVPIIYMLATSCLVLLIYCKIRTKKKQQDS